MFNEIKDAIKKLEDKIWIQKHTAAYNASLASLKTVEYLISLHPATDFKAVEIIDIFNNFYKLIIGCDNKMMYEKQYIPKFGEGWWQEDIFISIAEIIGSPIDIQIPAPDLFANCYESPFGESWWNDCYNLLDKI